MSEEVREEIIAVLTDEKLKQICPIKPEDRGCRLNMGQVKGIKTVRECYNLKECRRIINRFVNRLHEKRLAAKESKVEINRDGIKQEHAGNMP